MTISELREHPEYAKCFKKIRSYPKGFDFLIKWKDIPRAKANALRIVMDDAIEQGLLESLRIREDLNGEIVSERFRKISEKEVE